MTRRRGGARTRRGAGLVEIILAMMIFALIASSYAAVTLRYSTRMKTVSAGAARTAILSANLNRLMAFPFDQLSSLNDICTTTPTGALPNTVCIRVYTVTAAKDTVKLILTPTQTIIKPDTIVLTRVRRPAASPLGGS